MVKCINMERLELNWKNLNLKMGWSRRNPLEKGILSSINPLGAILKDLNGKVVLNTAGEKIYDRNKYE